MAGDDGIPSKPACEQRPDLAGCEVYKKKFKKIKVPPKTGVNNSALASDGTPSEPDSMYGDDGISHGPSTVSMTDEAMRALAERQAGETPVAANSVWKKVRAHYSVNSDSLVVMMGARGYLY